MTRAEYEAKYGKSPEVKAPAASAAVAPQKPVAKMTRAEYKAKYGMDPVIQGAAPASAAAPEGDGFLETLVKDPIKTLLVKPAARTAEALGRTGVFGKNIQKGYEEMADSGQDIDLGVGSLGKYHVEGVKTGVEGAKQILGEAAKSASYLYGGAGEANAVKTAVKTGLKEAVKQGVKTGATSGALYGGGQAAEEGKDALDIASGAVKGGVAGAAAGAVVPVLGAGASKVVNKLSGGFADSAAAKAEQEALLKGAKPPEPPTAPPAGPTAVETPKPAPDARVAKVKLDESGNIVKDKPAIEAIRQGIPEKDVAAIKSGSATDMEKMRKMLEIRKKSMTNSLSPDRASDVAGNSLLDHAKFLEKTNRQASKDLDMVAQKLAGKKANPTEAIIQFGSDLDGAGIKVGKNGSLNFKGSDFEGIKGAQTAINNVWSRVWRAAKSGNALELHRLKRFIDETVTYGKSAEGLSGRAERLLKGLRHNVDHVLDTTFPQYNKVNTVYADTIGELNKLGDVMGHNFKVGETFANARIGTKLRGLFSNVQSRSDLRAILESLTATAKKYGHSTDDNILLQSKFADILEQMLGTEAGTSMSGALERATDTAGKATSIGNDLTNGRYVSGAIKAGKHVIDLTRGINEEAKLNALEALLGNAKKPRSVFGK